MHYVIYCYSEHAESICLIGNLETAELGPMNVAKQNSFIFVKTSHSTLHTWATLFWYVILSICHFFCKLNSIDHSLKSHLWKQIFYNDSCISQLVLQVSRNSKPYPFFFPYRRLTIYWHWLVIFVFLYF